MHEKHLSLLCCPDTGEPLTLTVHEARPNGLIVSGNLSSKSGKTYPIVRGIPRFVTSEKYAGSFGYEWARWPRVQFESDNASRPMAGHTTRMWDIITDSSKHEILNQKIVEFGCGSGRFLDVVRSNGGIAVGIDISMAVEAARKNFPEDPDVLIVQGDIVHPPFQSASFDGGYSIGVLHHTPAPEQGLKALSGTVKQGGWVACVVYPKQGFYAYPSVRRHRKINNNFKSWLGYTPALIYAYFSAHFLSRFFMFLQRVRLAALAKYFEEQWFPCLYIPDMRWRILDVFDAITPDIASTHTRDEVTQWMERAGCKDFSYPAWGDTAIVGTKS